MAKGKTMKNAIDADEAKALLVDELRRCADAAWNWGLTGLALDLEATLLRRCGVNLSAERDERLRAVDAGWRR
jgi:hypothetical protein